MNEEEKKYEYELDEEEKEILESFEKGDYSVSLLTDETRKKYREIAKNTLKKNKRINIRLSERDLESLKREAIREGIPYQTLASSILHKYSSGLLKAI